MPRKPRDVKSAAPSPSPARSVKSRTRSKTASTPEDPAPIQETPEEDGVDEAGEDDEDTAAEPENGLSEAVEDTEGEAEVSGSSESEKGKGKVSMADRMAKLKDLRVRMVRYFFHHVSTAEVESCRTSPAQRTERTSSPTIKNQRSPPKSFSDWRNSESSLRR